VCAGEAAEVTASPAKEVKSWEEQLSEGSIDCILVAPRYEPTEAECKHISAQLPSKQGKKKKKKKDPYVVNTDFIMECMLECKWMSPSRSQHFQVGPAANVFAEW
jgi:hypothetical protein